MEAFVQPTFEKPGARKRAARNGAPPNGAAPIVPLRRVRPADAAPALRTSHVAPRATTLTFVLADVVAFLLIAGIASWFDRFMHPAAGFAAPVPSVVAAGLIGVAFALKGMYSAVSMHPAQEMRRATMLSLIVGLSLVAGAVLVEAAPRMIMLVGVTGALAVVLVPTCRILSRTFFSRADWWGIPVVVVGSGPSGTAIIDAMRRWPELGFKPVALVQEDYGSRLSCGVPVIHDLSLLPTIATEHKVRYAVLAMPDRSPRSLARMLEGYGKFFKRIFVVPGPADAVVPWTTSRSYEGLLGYGVQHYASYTAAHVLKRSIDVAGAAAGLLIAGPLLLTIAALVRLNSSGAVFFRQERMGRNGRIFEVLKFRTMYEDAEVKLQDILSSDSERREEYRRYHKLREDPRVTPIGKWLRRYSLDELPQLWNVLKGDMSLIGPRAYLPAELSQMNGLARTVLQSPPGVTGLWQVSGRNHLSFEERVDLDAHYIQNWTPWLDLYILARTVPVVLTGEGAS